MIKKEEKDIQSYLIVEDLLTLGSLFLFALAHLSKFAKRLDKYQFSNALMHKSYVSSCII